MNTNKWGPSAWDLFHTMSYSDVCKMPKDITSEKYQLYLQTAEKQIIPFYKLLRQLLPCIHCRNSYNVYWKEEPLTMDIFQTKNGFKSWLYRLHNKVNYKLLNQGYTKTLINSKDVKHNYEKNDETSMLNSGYVFTSCIIYNYNENNKDYIPKFFKLLSSIHPSKTLRKQLKEYLKNSTNDDFKNRRKINKWYLESPIMKLQNYGKDEFIKLYNECS